MFKLLAIIVLFLLMYLTAYSQSKTEYFGTTGINVGINYANEKLSEANTYLTNDMIQARKTIQAGVIGQVKPLNGHGVGVDLGFGVSQKGYAFKNNNTLENNEESGYRLITHLEAPLNIRYYYAFEGYSISVLGGVYAGYALHGKTEISDMATVQYIEFENKKQRYDYGYNLGFGIDAVVFGLDFVWSRGLKDITYGHITPYSSRNKMFSLVLRLMIPSY